MIPFRNALFAALFFIIQNGFQMNWIFNAFDLLDQIHQKVDFHDSLSIIFFKENIHGFSCIRLKFNHLTLYEIRNSP